jgi:hypothetical protein
VKALDAGAEFAKTRELPSLGISRSWRQFDRNTGRPEDFPAIFLLECAILAPSAVRMIRSEARKLR